MNRSSIPAQSGHEPGHEHEWQLQERALREERDSTADGDDPVLTQYRQVARALRRNSLEVPHDFAATVAGAVRLPSAPAAWERGLLRGLFAMLGLSGLGAAVLYGGQWLQGFVVLWSSAPVTTYNWMLALAACLAVSWALPYWRLMQAKLRQG